MGIQRSSNNKSQKVFGFTRNTIVYCQKCRIKYNKVNVNDIKFHTRLHKAQILPKSIHIGDNFYQHKNSFYLMNSNEIVAKVTGKSFMESFIIKEVYFVSENYRSLLYTKLLSLFKNVEEYLPNL